MQSIQPTQHNQFTQQPTRDQRETFYPSHHIPSYIAQHMMSLPPGVGQTYKQHYYQRTNNDNNFTSSVVYHNPSTIPLANAPDYANYHQTTSDTTPIPQMTILNPNSTTYHTYNPYNPTGMAQVTPQWSGSNITTSEPQYHISSLFKSQYDNQMDQLSEESLICPHCRSIRPYFRLPNDTTNTLYCSKCRQAYYLCHIHKVILPGIGNRYDDKPLNQCQCIQSQGFLLQETWNQPFK